MFTSSALPSPVVGGQPGQQRASASKRCCGKFNVNSVKQRKVAGRSAHAQSPRQAATLDNLENLGVSNHAMSC